LIEDGHLIGASVNGAAKGYFLIETEEEWRRNLAVLDSRAMKTLVRRKHLRLAGEKRFGRELQPLLLEG